MDKLAAQGVRRRFARFRKGSQATVIAAFLLVAGAAVPAGASSIGGLLAAPAAYAGSGDFCTDYDLNPGEVCKGTESHSSYVELEGWNTDKKGLGSCVGVSGGSKSCSESTFGESYVESFCRSSCKGESGNPVVENNSPYNSVFTGWADWS